MKERKVGVAKYESVDREYLERRRLRKRAGWILLWALGVGAVISGDFFGWHYGLKEGGFWGLALATVLMAGMYFCMVFTIAELSAALPHAGGFYSFVRNALGPTGGFVCGVTDTIEYVITPVVIVVAIGAYLEALVPSVPVEVWWIVFYIIFVLANIRGAELALKIALAVTLGAIGVLAAFYVSTVWTGSFHWDLLFNIEPDPGQSSAFPRGVFGIFAAIPAAIWFYLAIEQLPLAAEESHDVVRDMPKALILGIATLLVLSLLTLILNTGVGGGAAALENSDKPLADGFEAVFGSGWVHKTFTFLALLGLVASFHAIIFAYGRVLFALSRAGYFPRWISVVNGHGCPHVALILGAAVGLLCALAIVRTRTAEGDSPLGMVLLNMAVFGAVISYFMVMVSYIVLRVRRPDLPRPYRSPLGVPGALIGAALSLLALCATFSDKGARPGVYGVAIFVVISLVYFVAYSRKRLVAQAPEEEAALLARAEDELAHR